MSLATEIFASPLIAEEALEHFRDLLGNPIPNEFLQLFAEVAEPDLALRNLERWLEATTNSGLHLQQLIAMPSLSRWLLVIFGSSQAMTDSLIQNPELAAIVLDPGELARKPEVSVILNEGRRLLTNATSYSHSLDRLRFLRQRWNLPIVINDLSRNWPEEQVWRSLSDLADALIQLTVESVWREFQQQKELVGDCPVVVVGFGKLGGHELNYSSDIDLAYVSPDGVDDDTERNLTKFCEMLGRALADRMGRGSIYRVDLRLRPYGSTGPLVASMRSFENYYRLYAEQWEVQALLRARPICGPSDLVARWQAMRFQHCFRPQLSEPELEAMLAMKTRIEERAAVEDLKRGAGGIRDVEFLVQALQLIHGHRFDTLREESTLGALAALEHHNVLDHAVAASLRSGYTFLRQLEHRCQLVGDQQTHSVPEKPEARLRLAMLMGEANWSDLEAKLDFHRRTIQTLYCSILQPSQDRSEAREEVTEKLGALAPSVLQWFDSMPSADSFYQSLAENRDSLDRVQTIARAAPRLVNELRTKIGLTEMLLSGEIEEDFDPAFFIDRLALDTPIKQLAEVFGRIRTHLLTHWVLQPDSDFGLHMSALADSLVIHCAKRLFVRFAIVGLGSYGSREMGLESDADLLFLVEKASDQAEAESQAQQLLALFGQLKRLGAGFGVDMRLRPDGGKGMLVRSLEAFGAYDLEGMAMWERFALGPARLIFGDKPAIELVKRVAYAQPLTPERLRELLAMKKRVETERVRPQHTRREVKLGFGGLNDIEWLVHLLEMRYPTATQAGGSERMDDRLRNLARARLINAVELEQLLYARGYLLSLRLRLGLLGLEKDVLPENPDKLDRLAKSMDLKNGNDLLARHELTIESVRAIYLTTLERLKA